MASQICPVVGALAINVLAARGLGPSARGELALFLQICYSANLIALLGRSRAYLAATGRPAGLGVALQELRLLLRLPLALAALAAVILGLVFGGAKLAGVVLAAALWVKMVGGLYGHTHRAAAITTRSGGLYLGATLTSQVLMVLCAAVLCLLRFDSVSAWLALYGVTTAVPYLVVDQMLRRREPVRVPELIRLRHTRALGIRLLPAGLSEALLTRADRFLLPALSSFDQLGMYVVVATMTELINWPLRQYIDGSTPKWTQQASVGLLRPWAILKATVLFAAAVSTVVALSTYCLLVPVFGSSYQKGVVLILPLSAAAGLYSLSLLGVALATATQRPRLAGWIAAAGMLASLPLYLLLIASHGALGAALASLAAYAISALLGLVAIQNIARGPWTGHNDS